MFPKINIHRQFKIQLGWEVGNDTTHCQLNKLVWYTEGFKTDRGAGAGTHGAKPSLPR